jgi:hypothetical protein
MLFLFARINPENTDADCECSRQCRKKGIDRLDNFYPLTRHRLDKKGTVGRLSSSKKGEKNSL